MIDLDWRLRPAPCISTCALNCIRLSSASHIDDASVGVGIISGGEEHEQEPAPSRAFASAREESLAKWARTESGTGNVIGNVTGARVRIGKIALRQRKPSDSCAHRLKMSTQEDRLLFPLARNSGHLWRLP